MKQLSYLLLVLILGIFFTSYNQVEAKKETPALSIPVEGAWKLVWAQYNDTLADMSNHTLVKMFANGSFSIFAHDSAGKINYAGYGKYNFEGDTYHEEFLYHNKTKFTVVEDWQDLSIKGDTMYLNGITKVVIGGKDVTSDMKKVREKLVRVNW